MFSAAQYVKEKQPAEKMSALTLLRRGSEEIAEASSSDSTRHFGSACRQSRSCCSSLQQRTVWQILNQTAWWRSVDLGHPPVVTKWGCYAVYRPGGQNSKSACIAIIYSFNNILEVQRRSPNLSAQRKRKILYKSECFLDHRSYFIAKIFAGTFIILTTSISVLQPKDVKPYVIK